MPRSSFPDLLDTLIPSAWDNLEERRIRTAREAGQFDNLSGIGYPLQLRGDTYTESEWQALFSVLEEADLRPAWIEESQEIRDEFWRFRANLGDT